MSQQVVHTATEYESEGLGPASIRVEQALWDAVRTPTILVVNDAEIDRRLLKAMLKAEPYRILEARRASEAITIIEQEPIDLIILEMMNPEMSGLDFCRRLKESRRTQLVPVVIMTSVQGVENEIASLSSGADEFLTKPLQPTLLRTRIQSMLRHKAAIDSLEEAETILFALAQAVEHRDKCTGDHCQRLASYSVAIGMALGVSRSETVALYRGGYLHDIGKIAVPDAILYKNGPLTDEEWLVMKAHTIQGEEICKPMKSLAPVLPVIRHHHEKWDGTGYPDGLAGEQIPLLARILQVADVYDALTTARPYKSAYPHDKAMQILRDEVSLGWRDPAMVALFQDLCDRAKGQPPALIPAIIPIQESLVNMGRALLKQG